MLTDDPFQGWGTTVPEAAAGVDPAVLAGALAEILPRGMMAHYRIVRLLGRGSMGLVFLAHDPTLARGVALKVLAPERAADPHARERFLREARAAATIHHEHVVPVYAVSQSGGLPFLVMKYIEGRSLEDKLRGEGPLPPAEVVRIGIQVAAGLVAAHAQGLVHRDIKPSNILLDGPDEEVRISDFGLARAVDDAGLTLAGVVAGTPLYMAPEQARGDAVDHRADLYSLGSVLYALCVGRPPFQGAGTDAVLRRVMDETPPAVHALQPAVPAALSDVIAKLHRLDPAQRYQSAAEVAERLGAIGDLSTAPPARQTARRGRLRLRRVLILVTAPLLVLGTALGLTEASGVTNVSALVRTVLNIRTRDGMLMVEVDDPGVSVIVEGGGEQVVIKGQGFHELRLRPGRHAVKAQKDGALSDENLVTIHQGGKQLVKVTRGGSLIAQGVPDAARATLHGHAQGATGVAFEPPDGRRLASVGYDRTVRLWDPRTGQATGMLSGHTEPVFAVAYSPDGRTLASAGWDRVVRLWDTRTGAPSGVLKGHGNWIWSLAFSPDGATLASAGADLTVRLWDVAGRTQRRKVSTSTIVRNLVFGPDGKVVVGACDTLPRSNVLVWDLATPDAVNFVEGHPGGTVCVAMSPDGSTLATGGYDQTVALWDVPAWKLRTRLRGHGAPVYALAFSPDGRLLASGEGDYRQPNRPGHVKVWDVGAGHERATIRGHDAGIIAAAFAPRGNTLATASFDETVKLWDDPEKPARAPAAR